MKTNTSADGRTIRSGRDWTIIEADWTAPPTFGELVSLKDEQAPGARIHVITDPPYGTATHEGTLRRTRRDAPGQAHEYSFDPINPARLVPLFMDVATAWIVAFGELEALGAYKAAALDVHTKGWKRAGVAVRKTPQPQISGDRPGQAADGVAIMHAPHSGHAQWNGGGRAGAWTLETCRDPDRFHETQKPLAIMLELVQDFTNEGDLIVDPYAGAATTGVAAIATGRRFIGVELQRKYAMGAAERLEAFQAGVQLGARRAGQRGLFELFGS